MLYYLDVLDVVNVEVPYCLRCLIKFLGLLNHFENWDLSIFDRNLGGLAAHFLDIVGFDVDHISRYIR